MHHPSTAVSASPALPIVGRDEELAWLDRCLHQAFEGQPQVALLSGEPGIGKTRLMRSVRIRAAERGFRVSIGSGDADGCAPYGLFAGMLDPHVQEMIVPATERSGLTDPRKPDASDLTPSMRAACQALLEQAAHDPSALVLDDLHWADEGSLRLLSQLVFAASDASLERRVPLLIVVAMRDLDPASSCCRTVARLEREPICARLHLGGLGEEEVRQLLRQLGIGRPSRGVIARVREITRGNPLFIRQLLLQLQRAGALRQSGGWWVLDEHVPDFRLPLDVAEALELRVQHLDASCSQVLSAAAVIGDRFSPDLLAAVSDATLAARAEAIDVATREQIIVAEGELFAFDHPMVRQVLYLALPPRARAAAHARVATELLRTHAGDERAVVLDVARHLVAAGGAVDARLVLRHAACAAEDAFDRGAWDVAGTFFDAAIAAAGREAGLLSVGARAALHQRAAVARFRDHDAAACLAHYEHAAALAGEAGDLGGLTRALAGCVHTQFTVSSVGYGERIDTSALESAVGELADRDPALTGFAYAEIAQALWTSRESERAHEMAERALQLGDRTGADFLCAEARRALALVAGQRMRVTEAVDHLERGLAAAERTGDNWLVSQLAQRLPFFYVWPGRLDRVENAARTAERLSQTVQDWGDHSLARAAVVCAAVAKGEFDRAEHEASRTLLLAQRSGYPWAGPIWLPAIARGRMLRGGYVDAEEALALLTRPGALFEEPGPAIEIAALLYRQRVRATACPDAAVREEIRSVLASIPPPTPVETRDANAVGVFCAIVETSELVGVTPLLEAAHDSLVAAFESGMRMAFGWVALVPRVLAISAALLGRGDARRWLEEAVVCGAAAGAGLELALARLQLAQVLATSSAPGDRQRAHDLALTAMRAFAAFGLEDALGRSRELAVALGATPDELPERSMLAAESAGLGPLDRAVLSRMAAGWSDEQIGAELALDADGVPTRVQRILRRLDAVTRRQAVEIAISRGLLDRERAVAASAPRRLGMRVVMFTDVGGSTALYARLGDVRAYELVQVHDAVVREALARTGGTEIRQTGDGIMASFESATRAAECAVDIQRMLARRREGLANATLAVRVGLHAGDVVTAAHDLFGNVVNTAARVCAEAVPGQVLLTEEVRCRIEAGAADVSALGQRRLEGLPVPLDLFELAW